MINILYLMMILFAIASIQTKLLRNAIIYLSVFSLLCSFCYLIYQAPDVAIAEAVIGCTLSTVLFLVAFKQYKVMRIYFCHCESIEKHTNRAILMRVMGRFAKKHELELDFITTITPVDTIINNQPFDLIVNLSDNKTIDIYGDNSNYHVEKILTNINENPEMPINFYHVKKEDSKELL